MQLPSGILTSQQIARLTGTPTLVVGCLNFEERSLSVPIQFWHQGILQPGIRLIELADPAGGVPDYTKECAEKLALNRDTLLKAGIRWVPRSGMVMDGETALIEHVDDLTKGAPATVILDVTALPKRHFCFYLRRLLANDDIPNVIVTYSEAGLGGYTTAPLACDVMSPDTFPGFAGSVRHEHTSLIVAVGFEALGLRSLIMSLQQDIQRDLKILLPFPAPIETVRRQWNTLRAITENDPLNLRRSSIAVIATWDTELVYRQVTQWNSADKNISLAPFGPKTHTLGMALFAIKYDASLWYTQPKVYHYNYTVGTGKTWWYAVKWQGIACTDR